jgi:hypothetical protein
MDEGEFQRGVNEAQTDIAVSAVRYFCQTRGSWGERFTELMRHRFGAQVIHVSDITSDGNTSYEQGYNTTIKAHLDRTFGNGAFDRTWAEIDAYRQECYRRWVSTQDRA